MTNAAARLVVWMLRKVGGRTLLAFCLLASVVGAAAGGLQGIIHGLRDASLASTALWGMLLGWLLARSRRSTWSASLLAASVGLAYILVKTAAVSLKLLSLARLLGEAAWQWLQIIGTDLKIFLTALANSVINAVVHSGVVPNAVVPNASPHAAVDTTLLSLLAQDIYSHLVDVFVHLQTWITGVLHGSPGFDPVASAFIWGLGIWGAAVWAAWFARRRNQPLVGVLPIGIALAASLSFSRSSAMLLGLLLFGAFLLQALILLERQERGWKQFNLDYAEDISIDTILWASALITGVVVSALAISFLSPQQIFKTLRELGQSSQEATQLGESLGLEKQYQTPEPTATPNPGELPAQHLLGAGPELNHEIVMTVQVDGVQAGQTYSASGLTWSAPSYYWRSVTYDIYTGHGWISSLTTSTFYHADQFAQPTAPPGYRALRQHVQLVNLPADRLYYSGELLSVDQDFQVDWRPANETETDFFAAALARPPANASYRVDSLVLQVGQVQLRAAGREYPQWVRDRYLQLPQGLPPRVTELAQRLIVQAATPYDQARQIEGYLRQFPYTLTVPAPPPDRDVADYFLFDLKKGYCDYYATAMVVLARAVGLPARLVTGFAPGSFDPQSGRFIITAAEAHSWVEVYLSGLGWVEFEPTSGRPALDRPEDVTSPPLIGLSGETPQAAAYGQLLQSMLTWAVGLFAAAGLLSVAWLLFDAWRLRRQEPAAALQAVYRRLYRQGQRLELSTPPGETPHEFAGQLSQRLAHLAAALRGRIAPPARKALTPADQETAQVIELYARSLYSRQPANAAERKQAIRAWQRLQRRLWLARLLKIFERPA